jgi:hypothetical protein
MAREEARSLTSSEIDELVKMIKAEEHYIISTIIENQNDALQNKSRVERLMYLDGLAQKLLSLKRS